jgi:hypothetical protein
MTNENPSYMQFFPENFTGSQTDLRRTDFLSQITGQPLITLTIHETHVHTQKHQIRCKMTISFRNISCLDLKQNSVKIFASKKSITLSVYLLRYFLFQLHCDYDYLNFMFIKAYHCPIKKHGNDARKDETEEDT